MLRLRVGRTIVALEGPDGRSESTRARVALAVEGGRVGIAGIGEDDGEVAARVASRPPAVARGVAGQILAAAARRSKPTGDIRIISPGQDAWWDEKWQSPYSLRHAEPARERELLVIEPLSEASFSPHLVRGVLYYVLWTSRYTRDKTWPAFRRPELELCIEDDLRGRDYEELVDELRDLWGQTRVRLPADRPVTPPVTPLRIAHGMSRIVFWVALVLAVVLGRSGAEPTRASIVAAAVAVLAVMTRRVAGARMQAELPRRRAPRRRHL